MNNATRTCKGCNQNVLSRFMRTVARVGVRRWRLCFACIEKGVPHPHVNLSQASKGVVVEDRRRCHSCDEWWPASYIARTNARGLHTCKGCVEAMAMELGIASAKRQRSSLSPPRSLEPRTLDAYHQRIAENETKDEAAFALLRAHRESAE